MKMTPEQYIKAAIIKADFSNFEAEDKANFSEVDFDAEITADNVDDLYNTLYELLQPTEDDFREGEVVTDINSSEFSSHYECNEVAFQADDGVWVGWTYWHGGGKYSDPDSIEWKAYAYFVNCKEEEKMVTVRTFKR